MAMHTMAYLNYALNIEAEAPRNLCCVAVTGICTVKKLPSLMTDVE